MPTVLLIGTLDTKGPETAYLRDRIQALGCSTLVLDSGILGEANGIVADLSRSEVARAAGSTIDALRNAGTRGKAVEEMLKGVRTLTVQLVEQHKVHGVVSLGGAEGAVIAGAAMKVLPIGFPKLIVSPIASGHRKFGPFMGTRDTLVMHSIVDILGLNPISCAVYDNAAAAIVGMAQAYAAAGSQSPRKLRPAVAATMLGNTTKPLLRIRPELEAKGYDFVIFHANGVGGPAMEDLLRQGYFDGLLDFTLSEVAGHIAGGFHDGGPDRMRAAAEYGTPQVIVPGCLDFVVFGNREEVPDKYAGRPTYYHNPEFTLVRLTPEEQLAAARALVEKVNLSVGPVRMIVPLQGGSVMDNVNGGSFYDAALNQQIRAVIQDGIKPSIDYHEIDAHINDDRFADAVLDHLLQILA